MLVVLIYTRFLAKLKRSATPAVTFDPWTTAIMLDFLQKSKALKAEAAALRAAPSPNEKEQDLAFTKAADLDRQAYVEEAMAGLAQQPSMDPTPVVDRRAATLAESKTREAEAQAVVAAAQADVERVEEALNRVSEHLDHLVARVNATNAKIPDLTSAVERLTHQEAAFYLGRFFKTRGYVAIVEELQSSLELLRSYEEFVNDLNDDFDEGMAQQRLLDEEQDAARLNVRQVLRVLDDAQDTVFLNTQRLNEARRENVEERWQALGETEQNERVDALRNQERLREIEARRLQDRREAWSSDAVRPLPVAVLPTLDASGQG